MSVASLPTDPRALAREGLARWKDDPARFATEALGLRLWHRQREMLDAVAIHDRVAVRSGHKVGKSTTMAILALWWCCTRRAARVAMTSATAFQVREILWRELKIRHRKAKLPLGGTLNETPATGLRFTGDREVIGFSTKEPERAAGISGENVLFLVDEGSGVPEEIFEAIEGNRAGGAKLVVCSNPTQTSGTFFDAFHTKAHLWHRVHVSSEEAADVTPHIPGLATRAWIREKEDDWGRASPLFAVRVLGEFPGQASNSVIGLTTVTGAVARHADAIPSGRLEAGLDAAREGDDDSELCLRRGHVEVARYTLPKGDGPAVAGAAYAHLKAHRIEGEIPRVKVDVIGVGASVFDALKAHEDLEVIPVNVARTADADEEYANLRGQLWFGLESWLRTGAILPDSKREGELVAPKFGFDARGRRLVEAKDKIKARLGRSPDRAEALMLAVYNPPVRFAEPVPPPVIDLPSNWQDSARAF